MQTDLAAYRARPALCVARRKLQATFANCEAR
jgi:hypothetical protein